MFNSVVLGNVLGSKGTIGNSGVVAGVVVAGKTVGNRSSNIGGDWGSNSLDSVVGDWSNNTIDSRVSRNRGNNAADSRVGGNRGNNTVHSRVGRNRGNNTVDSRVGSKRADRRNWSNHTVDSGKRRGNMADSSIGSYWDTSGVDSSRFSISITLSNGVNNRGTINSIVGGVGSESSEKGRAVAISRGVHIRQRSTRVHNLGFRLSEGNSGQSENSKHLHFDSDR